MNFGNHRFILVKDVDSRSAIKLRYVDALRANVPEDDPARHDDHAFAMGLLEAISKLADGEDITLNVLPKKGETT